MTIDPTTPAENGAVPLSVVIITENEEDRVRDCIESVFEACRDLPAFEVILVDSDSTDRTVELATEYPVTVLRIPDEHAISCGAGRYVGDRVASGEMVLHVDGDMTLTQTWLPRAIERLQDPDVAAVEGHLHEDDGTGTAAPPDDPDLGDVRDVDKVGGVMLYDADALREVGGFDPYLLGYEDIDVGFKLREAGYRLLRIPHISAVHHDEETVAEPLRRWRRGYLFAPGQAIRRSLGSPSMLWRLVRRQQYKVGLLAWGCLGLLSLLSTPLFLGWFLLSLVGFGVVASKRGPAGAVRFFVTKAFGLAGLAVGLRRRTPAAETYPVESVEVVAEGEVIAGGEVRAG